MENVDGDSAIANVTWNPSFDVDKPLEVLLPNPGPIPKRLECVPEEPCVEKDISGQGTPPASELRWGKKKPRSVKAVDIAQTLLSLTNEKADIPSRPNLRGSAKEHLPISKPVTTDADRKMRRVEFLFEKTLTKSADQYKRMVIPKKKADEYLAHVRPPIGCKQMIVMKDLHTDQSWEFNYRLWIHNGKTMHTLQKIGAYIKAHNLQEGDLLCFYKTSEGDYVIQGKLGQQRGPHVLRQQAPT